MKRTAGFCARLRLTSVLLFVRTAGEGEYSEEQGVVI